MPYLLLKDLPRYDCLLEAAKEFPDLDPSAAEAFLHLLRTSDEVFGVTDRNLGDHNISHGRFGVLMLLWQGGQPRPASPMAPDLCIPGPRTPAELADAAGVTRATMTGPDPADRRTISVRLTTKGGKFLGKFLPGHFKLISELMAPLSEPERKTLVRLLNKVQQQAAELNPRREPAAAAVG